MTRPSLQSLARQWFVAFYYAPAAIHDCVLHTGDGSPGIAFDIHAQGICPATSCCGPFLKPFPLGLKEFFCHASVYVHFDKPAKNNTFGS